MALVCTIPQSNAVYEELGYLDCNTNRQCLCLGEAYILQLAAIICWGTYRYFMKYILNFLEREAEIIK